MNGDGIAALLTEAVSLLRQALDDDPKNPSYIQTVHRRGYRFVAAVAIVGRAVDTRSADTSRKPPPEPDRSQQPVRGRRWIIHLAMAAMGLAVVVAVLLAFLLRGLEVKSVGTTAIRLDVSSPQGISLPFFTTAALALSPAGDVLVFVGRDSDGTTQLYRRRISEFDSHAIPGTEGAGSPFFSPDGSWVAFFAESELRKTPLDGGAVIRICRSSFAFGGSWADDGKIIFAGSHPRGLSVVSANGGKVDDLTLLRVADGEIGHWWPQVLPDSRGVVYTIWSSTLAVTVLDGARSDVWTTPIESPILNRLTFSGFNIEPRWSPDGQWVAFASNRDGPFNIYRKPADGDGLAERLAASEFHQYPGGFTPDGRSLVYSQADPVTGSDIWIVTIDDGERSVRPVLRTPANENFPTLSPDGRWLAYISDESGRWEVYLRSVSGDGGVWQVSTGGAGEAFWSADGSRVYYGQKNSLVSVPVTFEPELSLGQKSRFPWADDLTVIDTLPGTGDFIAIKELAEHPSIDAVRVVVDPG